MEKIITYFDKQVKVACDEKCEKAWGGTRPKEKLSDDDDDVVYLSDSELGKAPVDPGTYEGGQAKPVEKQNIPNKWCVRQCERCVWGDIDKPIQLKDWSKRRYNQPWKHKVMNFILAEDSEDLYQRLVSEDGKIEMGIYPVMYGYRVRAGYVGSMICQLDWCGGDDQGQLELLYSIAKNILEFKGSFTGVPDRSNIKPFYNDKEFVEFINSLTTKPLEIVKLQPLYESKNKLLNKL